MITFFKKNNNEILLKFRGCFVCLHEKGLMIWGILDFFVGLLPYIGFTLLIFVLPAFGVNRIPIKSTKFRSATYIFYKYFPSGRFHFYYTSDKQIKEDAKAMKMAEICHHGYVDSQYDYYYNRLSEYHFPILILINWTRTIVDDLVKSSFPVNQVIIWDDYLRRCGDGVLKSIHPAFLEYNDHELAYLWGAVYFWLRNLTEDFCNEELFSNIEKVGTKKTYAKPYFEFFRSQTNGATLPVTKTEEEIKPMFCLASGQIGNFAKIIQVLCDMRIIVKSNGEQARPVSEVGKQIGSVLGEKYGNWSQTLKAAFDQQNYLEVFTDMEMAAKRYLQKKSK